MSASKILDELRQFARTDKAEFFPRFFHAEPGGYGEGDKFLGVMVPDQRSVAKTYRGLSRNELSKLFHSAWHEARLTAVHILVLQFQRSRTGKHADELVARELLDFYFQHLSAINNWDLVDTSAPKIVGAWLLDHPDERRILDDMAGSGMLWQERIAVVANYPLIRSDQFEPFLRIAKQLRTHSHDLIQKAIGWMLREVWKRDPSVAEAFLDRHYADLSRTTLRYAIERMTRAERDHWLYR